MTPAPTPRRHSPLCRDLLPTDDAATPTAKETRRSTDGEATYAAKGTQHRRSLPTMPLLPRPRGPSAVALRPLSMTRTRPQAPVAPSARTMERNNLDLLDIPGRHA